MCVCVCVSVCLCDERGREVRERVCVCVCVNIAVCMYVGSNGCKYLEHIDISWCVLMTDEAVEILSRSCTRITVFICRGLEHVSTRT